MSASPPSVALVTGAARGIGRAIAERLAEEYEILFLIDLEDAPLQEVAEELRSEKSSTVHTHTGDVAREETAAALRKLVSEKSGRLDLLVNNAGITGAREWLPGMSSERFARTLAVNATAPFLLSKALASLLAKGAGSIVNVSSVSGQRAFRGHTSYSASKAAVEGLTRALALDLGPYGVRVNAVAPGMIETEAWSVYDDKERQRVAAMAPLRRYGTAAEVAEAVAFLGSARAGYISGQVLAVDGALGVQAFSPSDEIPHRIAEPPRDYPEG